MKRFCMLYIDNWLVYAVVVFLLEVVIVTSFIRFC
jgi:hypothetical protein